MKVQRPWLNRLAMIAGISCVSLLVFHVNRTCLAQPTSQGKKQEAQVGTIEETKKKGFEGVDFSYDVFGAPPGQDPQRLAHEVMKKDIVDKPDVMKRHQKLLSERYDLSCRTEKALIMTNGKLQPIGPAVKLPSGISWEQLAQQ
ncbi:MAG TPA: hypothetical protein VFP04_01385, partial [Nitrospira sp.]|nr:hypothetical protein [Nitrospira sp.]